jgi:Spondin_N
MHPPVRFAIASLLALTTLTSLTHAEGVAVRVTVENLAPANSISFAPLRIGFHDGSYDPFNEGEPANAATISIAEGGGGDAFFSDFAMAQSSALLGSVLPNPAGPLLPGGMGMAEFTIDPVSQRYFTFGSMAVPSNDYFIGNDSPTEYSLFDRKGSFVPQTILQRASDLWDAGSEVDGAFGSAFLMGSMNSDHIDENGVVHFDFADLSIFNGLTTAVGYVFSSQLAAETEVYRITITAVPACDADLNGSGTVGAEDLALLLGAWGMAGGGTGNADLDGDGMVGSSDLAILLGEWGSCP